ncbi:MAG: hypothetical protein A3J66_02260 [Candidatus Magasanikbacteria bacterium RIFCSPHIGHO2_02_FULL_47_14]|uniref:Vitamin K epoxide reductase domain-containing protein n=1 Tax=Candidatus Magasanikbacteria bacterium RIFCSPHIGHO2_02_FULL_47_14 TaxID=1798680 RepID=A0A1F6M1A1_9BACT|nr:MAG: hypothetical protein A3J66_02260 [Candidatus Magasanikbacteria bacterium RIFCSPHIGHO2_02_FULL_47_14]
MARKLLYLQTLILVGGIAFSWATLVNQFITFYNTYGTLFRVKDCTIPNPVTTACFYGALAFVFAFFWSFLLLLRTTLKSQKYLRNFLLFGVVFALSVLTYEFLVYYRVIVPPVQGIGCSPGVFPLKTPCLRGALFFIASFITAFFATRELKKEKTEHK